MKTHNSSRQGNERESTVEDKKRSAGVPPVPFVHHDPQIGIRARRLPHWEATEATYFVTFRLADSLPREVLQQIEFQRKDIPATAAQMQRALTGEERGAWPNYTPACLKDIWTLELEGVGSAMLLLLRPLLILCANSMAPDIGCLPGA